MGHEFPFGGHMLHFFSDYLDLTSAQQDQVKAIMEKEKPAIQSAMQQMGQFHSQMRALEEASTFDEAKVRALAAQQSQAMTEMIVQKARIKNELLADSDAGPESETGPVRSQARTAHAASHAGTSKTRTLTRRSRSLSYPGGGRSINSGPARLFWIQSPWNALTYSIPD